MQLGVGLTEVLSRDFMALWEQAEPFLMPQVDVLLQPRVSLDLSKSLLFFYSLVNASVCRYFFYKQDELYLHIAFAIKTTRLEKRIKKILA